MLFCDVARSERDLVTPRDSKKLVSEKWKLEIESDVKMDVIMTSKLGNLRLK